MSHVAFSITMICVRDVNRHILNLTWHTYQVVAYVAGQLKHAGFPCTVCDQQGTHTHTHTYTYTRTHTHAHTHIHTNVLTPVHDI